MEQKGPLHYSSKYGHEQSSLDFLINVSKLGTHTLQVVNTVAFKSDKVASLNVSTSDFTSPSFIKCGHMDLAAKLWSDFSELGSIWELQCGCHFSTLMQIFEVHPEWLMMWREGIQPDMLSYCTLILALFDDCQIEEAMKNFGEYQCLFEDHSDHAITVYNTVIWGFSSHTHRNDYIPGNQKGSHSYANCLCTTQWNSLYTSAQSCCKGSSWYTWSGHSDTTVHSYFAPWPWWAGGNSITSSGLVWKTFTTVSPYNYQRWLIHMSVAVKIAPEVPDLSAYRTNPDNNHIFSYFMVSSFSIISASAAKSSMSKFLQSMAASTNILAQVALTKVEVDFSTIPEGKNMIIKWTNTRYLSIQYSPCLPRLTQWFQGSCQCGHYNVSCQHFKQHCHLFD